MTLFAQSSRASTVRPACAKCGAPMWLTRIQPDKRARRTLECPRCQHRIIEVIELGNAA
jgi:DNA-directed RNA polymerase subunit RPC12/RpoP